MNKTINTGFEICISKRELRILLVHEFRLGHKETEAALNICNTIGTGVVSNRVAQLWFDRFKNDNFELDDCPRSGRPLKVNIEELKRLIEEDPRSNTRYLGEQLGCSHVTIENHLKGLGKVWKYGVCIPHELSENQYQNRINTCIELLSFKRNYKWLENIITADEKWVLYINYKHKKQWLEPGQESIETPKMGFHAKKIMISVWWNTKGVIHWELLPPKTTVTANLYCEQLDRVVEKLIGKQSKVYYLHDNARPHICKVTQKNCWILDRLFCHIHHILLTLPLLTIICSFLLLMT